jgi:hypothetical protein
MEEQPLQVVELVLEQLEQVLEVLVVLGECKPQGQLVGQLVERLGVQDQGSKSQHRWVAKLDPRCLLSHQVGHRLPAVGLLLVGVGHHQVGRLGGQFSI